MPLANFFVALGIPQVGRKTGKLLAGFVAEKVASVFGRNLIDVLLSLTYEELEAIHDV